MQDDYENLKKRLEEFETLLFFIKDSTAVLNHLDREHIDEIERLLNVAQ